MIVALCGTIVDLSLSSLVLEVQGISYELGISSNTAQSLPKVGESGVSIYTRMVIKENALDLYGFATKEERKVFDKLLAISGVGPKLALSILSVFSPAALANVVLMQDDKRMSQVPGVGKKTAQRLLVELADVFTKDLDLKSLAGAASTTEAASPVTTTSTEAYAEAEAALLSMGFSPQECELALAELKGKADMSVEQILAAALKRLGGGF